MKNHIPQPKLLPYMATCALKNLLSNRYDKENTSENYCDSICTCIPGTMIYAPEIDFDDYSIKTWQESLQNCALPSAPST